MVRELQAAGFPRPRIHDLPNGVPLPPSRSLTAQRTARRTLADAHAMLSLPDRAPLAVYTGRLHRSRRLKYLVAAWRTIVGRWPNARLWLVGAGPDREMLLRQIEGLKLAGRVVPVGVFHGVDELLAAADLFVSPSTAAGVSVSVLEAMAAGLPIMAADSSGNRTVITDGQHGLLVPPDDADALAAAIFRLLDGPELAERLGAAARRRAADEFSLAQMVDRHLELFHHLTRPEQDLAGTVPSLRDDPS
jgi:glycosyltransferase involved in cell wall biosynthesis